MDDRLQAIRERVEKATKGPWSSSGESHPYAVKNKLECASVRSDGEGCLIYKMPRDYGCLPETWERQLADADFIAHSRADIEFLLAKLDQAGKLAEDLEMLTDQKGEIGSFLKTRFPASLKIAQDSLDAWKGTPTPPEVKP